MPPFALQIPSGALEPQPMNVVPSKQVADQESPSQSTQHITPLRSMQRVPDVGHSQSSAINEKADTVTIKQRDTTVFFIVYIYSFSRQGSLADVVDQIEKMNPGFDRKTPRCARHAELPCRNPNSIFIATLPDETCKPSR